MSNSAYSHKWHHRSVTTSVLGSIPVISHTAAILKEVTRKLSHQWLRGFFIFYLLNAYLLDTYLMHSIE